MEVNETLKEHLAMASEMRELKTDEPFDSVKQSILDLFQENERDQAISRELAQATTPAELGEVIIKYSEPVSDGGESYALFRHRGRSIRTSRLLWNTFHYDPVPLGGTGDGRTIIYLDKNPANLDPFNLFMVTGKENYHLIRSDQSKSSCAEDSQWNDDGEHGEPMDDDTSLDDMI